MNTATSSAQPGTIEKRTLGATGLSVSRAVLGTMTFGSQADAAAAEAMVNLCRERGVNFLDTANVYNGGKSEEILGEILKGRRDKFVLATKAGIKVGDSPEDSGLSRAAILRQCERSLSRLKTDYVDLFYLHQPDANTPLEESLGALEELIKAGKVRHAAASNYAAWQHSQMLCMHEKGHGPRIGVSQPMYNLLARGIEQEFLPACQALKIATVAYNPLAAGLLTGKQKGDAPLPGTRFAQSEVYRNRYWHKGNFQAVQELSELAARNGRSLVSLSLNWILHHTPVDCIILGASKVSQLEENLNAFPDGPLSPEAVAQCDEIWNELRGPAPKYNR